MFTTQQLPSHVRNACDACHRRKIRCITSRNGGPCHHCQSRGLSCYFLPRSRSGRPRLNQPPPSALSIDHDALVMTPPPYTTIAGHGSQSAIFERCSQSDFSVTPNCQQGYRLQDPLQVLKSPSIADHLLLEIPQHSLYAEFAGSLHSHGSFADLSDNDGVFETTSTPQSAKFSAGATPWSTPSQGSLDQGASAEVQNRAFQEYAFSSLLQQCLKLQRHLLAAEDFSAQASDDGSPSLPHQRVEVPDSQLQAMLEDVEANCKLIIEICEKGALPSKSPPGHATGVPEKSPPTLLDPASISLMTAIIFKALQVCNVLLSGAGLRAGSIADLLLYKRLDVNITLARIVISKVETLVLNSLFPWQELSDRAICIEKEFADKRRKMEASVS